MVPFSQVGGRVGVTLPTVTVIVFAALHQYQADPTLNLTAAVTLTTATIRRTLM